MYAFLRCARPRCRIRTCIPARSFHQTHWRNNAESTSDPAETKGDDVRRPATSKWNRRRRQEMQRNGVSDSYMIVDPATGSAEIIDNRNGKSKSNRASQRLPPVELPQWFDDLVTWPIAGHVSSQKQVAFLPSKDRHITGMSFLENKEMTKDDESKGGQDNAEGETTPPNLEDANRMWLDPLLFTEIDGVIRTGLELPTANKKDTPLSLRSMVSIHCPLEGGMPLLNDIIEHISATQGAGMLRLDVQDLAELGGAFVFPDAGLDDSLQTLPFDAYNEAVDEVTNEEQDNMDREDEEAAVSEDEDPSRPKPPKTQITGMWLAPAILPSQGGSLPNMLKNLMGGQFPGTGGNNAMETKKATRKAEEDEESNPIMDEQRLGKFLNALIDGAWAKQATAAAATTTESNLAPKLIVCLEDLIRLSQTAIGIELVEKLAEVVRKRRSEDGERIALVGLSIDTDLLNSHEPEKTVQWEMDNSIWRTFIVTPHAANGSVISSKHPTLAAARNSRNAQINLRNWYTTAAQMAPALLSGRKHILQPENNGLGQAIGLSRAVLPRDEIHRLATSSIARVLAQNREKVGLDDLVSAMADSRVIDTLRESRLSTLRASEAKNSAFDPLGGFNNLFNSNMNSSMPLGFGSEDPKSASTLDVSARLQTLQKEADRYEKKLINGVVLPEKMKTTFAEVHVAKATVEAVRDLTALSLQRPDAFKYGVLATNTLSGLLLYGPPGTGKTMLAKAVAKESEAAVLTITGSDVNQMWVGESEKTVKAIFTLARKLAPCIVFIDEADALLASRGGDGRGGKPNHRDTINQFLLEWDGMNESGVFLMVATNRPFDLDDAVLRRLPRRVLVDLPTQADREAILRIHTQEEKLADSVSLADLAAKTPFYSGSDLKNVVVSAALSAVRDELEAKKAHDAAQSTTDGAIKEDYIFPEQRTLDSKHFDKAMGEVGASVSADMSSLKAVRKFDEQFGERKGRKKARPFGLGARVEEKESDARVRA